MEISCESSCLNNVSSSDMSSASIVLMLQQLLESSSFNETEIKRLVDLLKQTRDNNEICKDSVQKMEESPAPSANIDDSIQKMEELSAPSSDIDEIMKRAESLLNILENQTLGAKFSGETVDWFRFWEAFEREIHSREDLPVALKFACLKRRLEDWPLNGVEKLGSGESAYNEALKLLKTTFSNKKVLVECHLNALLDLKTPSFSPVSLMRFSSDFEYHISALKGYGTTIEEAGFFTAAVLNKKLPKEICNRINKADRTSHWTFPEFQNALKAEIQLLDSEFIGKANDEMESQNVTAHTGEDSSACTSEAECVKGFKDPSKVKKLCPFCSGYHMILSCKQYRTQEERLERAKQLGLCLLCLKTEHPTENCYKTTGCKVCNGTHNTLVCTWKREKVEKYFNQLCPLCNGCHVVTGCSAYRSSGKKMKRAMFLGLCLLCFKDEHPTDECWKKDGCKFCSGRHNTLLCGSRSKANQNKTKRESKTCPLCSEIHDICSCPTYRTSAEKRERAKELELCLLCIKSKHMIEECLKKEGCKLCKDMHNTLLCVSTKSNL